MKRTLAHSTVIRRNGAPVVRTREQAIKLLGTNFTVRGECHEWRGAKTKGGYPLITFRGKTRYAHRLALENKIGKLKRGICALHRCDNPPCINPDHLFAGTKKDNSEDMTQKGRWGNKVMPGSLNGFARLTEGKVKRMRQMKGRGRSYREIGLLFGVAASTAGYAVKYGWRHVK
ncbi:MAG TPA: HNH endonuclease signature motif containing protein [Terriglobales bacterium]|nr:HNH endonuclease signature motif containing protein [Terriglobales bacterium]